MKSVMKSVMKNDWIQSKPLLYFLFFLYFFAIFIFILREDTPSLIVLYLLFLLFFLISKNMIIVFGSSLFSMLILILLRQSVKEGLTQPEEPNPEGVKPGEPLTGSKKIPEDKEPEDKFETMFKTLETNLNSINRIEEETRLKLNSMKELYVKEAKGPNKPEPVP